MNKMEKIINIRYANESDVDSIYYIYEKEGWISFNRDMVKSLVVDSNSVYLVVEKNNKIIGFSRYLTDNVLTVFLAEIIVDQKYRNQGIGKCMIDEIFKLNKNQRIELMTDNPKFYERLKFRKIGDAYRRYQNKDKKY